MLRWPAFLRLWVGVPALLVLGFLARQMPPDGAERAALAQFFGRFHPTVVHFPIALLALVLLLELAGATRRGARLRDAAGCVLGLATVAAFAAGYLGWLLARSGGYRSPIVTRHLWSGVWLCGACLLCGALRRRPPRSPGVPYGVALAGAVALMVWTSHLGGELSHGDNYLTEYMPATVRAWLGLPPPKKAALHPQGAAAAAEAGRPSFYFTTVAPILKEHCTRCHEASRHKGKLRLDTYEWIMSGGEDGLVVKPDDPKGSELYRRITLPPDDDDFMPNDGRRPLSPYEVKIIEHWIATGATAMLPDDFKPVVTPAHTASH